MPPCSAPKLDHGTGVVPEAKFDGVHAVGGLSKATRARARGARRRAWRICAGPQHAGAIGRQAPDASLNRRVIGGQEIRDELEEPAAIALAHLPDEIRGGGEVARDVFGEQVSPLLGQPCSDARLKLTDESFEAGDFPLEHGILFTAGQLAAKLMPSGGAQLLQFAQIATLLRVEVLEIDSRACGSDGGR